MKQYSILIIELDLPYFQADLEISEILDSKFQKDHSRKP